VVFSGKGVAGLEGERLAAACKAGKWLLLNPEMPPQALVEALELYPPVRILWGEFHPGNARYVWERFSAEDNHNSFEQATAAGQYLPNWAELLNHAFSATTDS
jgi:hypothetical protein